MKTRMGVAAALARFGFFFVIALPSAFSSTAQEGDTRQDPPEAAAQKDTLQFIRDLYKDDYARRKPADQRVLAGKLLGKAREEGDPKIRFVLLKEASDLAAKAGDTAVCLKALDALAKGFRMDSARLRADALAILARQARSPEAAGDIARGYLAAVEDALGRDDFKLAKSLLSRADRAARAARDANLAARCRAKKGEVDVLRQEHATMVSAEKKLKENPEDGKANTAVGRYLCLFKGDWEKGLPLLAKGSDSKHQTVAKAELAGAATPPDQARLGDWWWNLAEEQKRGLETYYRNRAGYWYEQASTGLTGLAKMKVDQRLDTLESAQPGFVNLLRLVDLGKDTVNGTWKLEGGHLISDAVEVSRVEVPYRPPSEYDLRLTFSRISGSSSISVILSRSGRAFVCTLGGGNIYFGLGECQGKWTNDVSNPTVTRIPGAFSPGRDYKVLIEVRREQVRVHVDGKLIIDWEGNYADFSMREGWKLRDPSVLGLGTFESPTAFKKFVLVERTGSGKKSR